MNPSKRCFLLTALLLSGGANLAHAQTAQIAEPQLLAVLKSDAAYKEKHEALEALALRGSKEAVPTLAGLLHDEKLNHMARYALEQIDDPAGEAALRGALGTAKGLPLIGVIDSLGSMRDVKAIAPLAKLLNSTETGVADAAAVSLGRIGTPAASKVLQTALAKPTPALYDAALRCGETLSGKDAALLYDALRKPTAPQPIRMAALRGAILSRGEQGVPIIAQAMAGADYAQVLAAAQTARELRGANVTKALAASLDKLPADRQILLLQVLGDRDDSVATAPLLAFARKSNGEARATAVKSLVQIGDVATLPFLAEQAGSENTDVANAARAGLAGFAGREAEAPIVGMLKSTNPKARQVAAELIAQRKMTGVMPQILVGANDAAPAVANSNIRAIGEIGGAAEVPALLKILLAGKSTGEAERALSAIYNRNREATVENALIAALPTAPQAAKGSLMRVLRRVGSPQGLAAVRLTLTDANADVREGAMRNLAEWPSADALPDLLTLAKTPPTPTIKILALRGMLRLIPLQNGSPEQKLASVKETMRLIDRPEEKRLALAVLGTVPTTESLALVVPELNNPDLKTEASLAAVAIGEQLAKTQPTVVSDAMGLVIKSTADQELIKRAQALMPNKTP